MLGVNSGTKPIDLRKQLTKLIKKDFWERMLVAVASILMYMYIQGPELIYAVKRQ